MYANYFDRVSLHLPFSPFQIEVLNHLRIRSSQLHLNAWGFILSFKKLCVHRNFFLSLNLFCYFFVSWHGKTPSNGYPCLSLRGCRDMYIHKGFEESFNFFNELPFWLGPIKYC